MTVHLPTTPRVTSSAGMPHPDRLRSLSRVRELLVEQPDQVLDELTKFTTIGAARYELAAAIATLDGALAECQRHRPAAVRNIAVFMPSNVLLYSYVLYLLVPSLFADRVVLRPASQTAEHLQRLHAMLAPVHGLPIEPLMVSQRAFVWDAVLPADVVVFTGAYQNAEQIRPQLRAEQLLLFLGAGVNPFIVAPGADLAAAARDAVQIRMFNTGQDCLAPDLFCVQESDADAFLDLLLKEVKGLRYGEYADPTADYGSIFYHGALEAAALFLFKNRANIVHGGSIDFRSRRVEPAVVVSPLDGRSGDTEFFAPVFNVAVYPDEATATRILTSGIYAERALGASVYGDAPALTAALARRHTVTINASMFSVDDGNAPFGGWGPMASYAAYSGRLHVGPILVSQAVARHLGQAGEPVEPDVGETGMGAR
ncbi:aldehyde dehydrogenase family protein [Salinispora vitiensis]|uniref:aldehyde dehydrogenase family protein n=1 Tax=Salinispora vitiensis TaxID=999544 RepID=UPI00036D9BB6|nr:aldehyde dehydrogenase family protein [Salinispora vitiensis]